MANVDPGDLVFIDACGSSAAKARAYGSGPRGERVHGAKPVNDGLNLSTIGALTLEGLDAVMSVGGATSGGPVPGHG